MTKDQGLDMPSKIRALLEGQEVNKQFCYAYTQKFILTFSTHVVND
ncbi:hypothetical protein SBF1_1410001 [Candidatus Desulfosporosinus infrequens]|uniref:Uncharacterized protein n=1 Tax=Candidatus Desulfosporosinus infrequens TaxID=2043169 RepID=A0A2U3K5A6_9FIRM|nr:hypothetical protein SBF1_1410001 [Candidatus Desulfosporosinus infrequens]